MQQAVGCLVRYEPMTASAQRAAGEDCLRGASQGLPPRGEPRTADPTVLLSRYETKSNLIKLLNGKCRVDDIVHTYDRDLDPQSVGTATTIENH